MKAKYITKLRKKINHYILTDLENKTKHTIYGYDIEDAYNRYYSRFKPYSWPKSLISCSYDIFTKFSIVKEGKPSRFTTYWY